MKKSLYFSKLDYFKEKLQYSKKNLINCFPYLEDIILEVSRKNSEKEARKIKRRACACVILTYLSQKHIVFDKLQDLVKIVFS
jgi:hypothetical protein